MIRRASGSGGLGVEGSNPFAPTKYPNICNLVSGRAVYRAPSVYSRFTIIGLVSFEVQAWTYSMAVLSVSVCVLN
jgi:hypothetical protein